MERVEYRGTGQRPADAPQAQWKSRPDLYRPTSDVVSAVNVAILLGKPLLVTGEPGTGKTDLAKAVAWELGLDEPLQFDTRSTSEARQLFYTYDALARFQAAHSGATSAAADADPGNFIRFQALGRAILRSNGGAAWNGDFPAEDLPPNAVRSVVLVDEIDKASRDFPNDLLGAIEQMSFAIPEVPGKTLVANDALKPIVIATSNSENVLPEPFLRRCVYHHIDPPGPELLSKIVTLRATQHVEVLMKKAIEPRLVDRALKLFDELRAAPLAKAPATAELIDWVVALHDRPDTRNGTITPDAIRATLGVVIKRKEDREEGLRAMHVDLGGD